MEVVKIDTAEEVLGYLRQTNEVWHIGQWGLSRWIFRGQGDARWQLVPRSFRPNVVLGYRREASSNGPLPNIYAHNTYETAAVVEFLRLADAIGLAVPGDGQIYRTPEGMMSLFSGNIENNSWPPDEVLPTLAIAQHHGVPTRLLDFTEKPLVAAFFAAKQAYQLGQHPDKCKRLAPTAKFAVWSVHRNALSFAATATPCRIRIVTVPRAQNQFLHAQSGLFLYDRDVNQEWLNDAKYPPMEEVIENIVSKGSDDPDFRYYERNPAIVKLEIPVSCAKDLLKLLVHENVSAAHLMPTYDSVVQTLEFEREIDAQ